MENISIDECSNIGYIFLFIVRESDSIGKHFGSYRSYRQPDLKSHMLKIPWGCLTLPGCMMVCQDRAIIAISSLDTTHFPSPLSMLLLLNCHSYFVLKRNICCPSQQVFICAINLLSTCRIIQTP